MNYKIRAFKESDFEEIARWWIDQGEAPPLPGMMVEGGTFILEIDGVAALTQTIFLTQSKEITYLEGFCKNPQFKTVSLENYIPHLWEAVFNFAISKGYKRVLGYCKVEKLKDKYQRLGLTKVMDNLSGFTKEFLCHGWQQEQ